MVNDKRDEDVHIPTDWKMTGLMVLSFVVYMLFIGAFFCAATYLQELFPTHLVVLRIGYITAVLLLSLIFYLILAKLYYPKEDYDV